MQLPDFILLLLIGVIIYGFVQGTLHLRNDVTKTDIEVVLIMLIAVPLVLLEIWALYSRIHWA